jgi:hypothetical protein
MKTKPIQRTAWQFEVVEPRAVNGLTLIHPFSQEPFLTRVSLASAGHGAGLALTKVDESGSVRT